MYLGEYTHQLIYQSLRHIFREYQYFHNQRRSLHLKKPTAFVIKIIIQHTMLILLNVLLVKQVKESWYRIRPSLGTFLPKKERIGI